MSQRQWVRSVVVTTVGQAPRQHVVISGLPRAMTSRGVTAAIRMRSGGFPMP